MVTSGLVITLSLDGDLASMAEESLRMFGAVQLQERCGSWIGAALEAPDKEVLEEWHEWIRRLPGVAQVEIAFVHFEVEKQNRDEGEVVHAG